LEDLTPLIVENHLLMHLVESQWLKRFSLHLCLRVNLLELVEKTKQLYILPNLTYCYFIIASFNLWMSKGAYDIFAPPPFFWRPNWQPNILQLGFSKHLIPLGMH